MSKWCQLHSIYENYICWLWLDEIPHNSRNSNDILAHGLCILLSKQKEFSNADPSGSDGQKKEKKGTFKQGKVVIPPSNDFIFWQHEPIVSFVFGTPQNVSRYTIALHYTGRS